MCHPGSILNNMPSFGGLSCIFELSKIVSLSVIISALTAEEKFVVVNPFSAFIVGDVKDTRERKTMMKNLCISLRNAFLN